MIRISESRGRQVIDNQDQVERLLRKLTEVLPLSALATPVLMANLRGRSAKITLDCKVRRGAASKTAASGAAGPDDRPIRGLCDARFGLGICIAALPAYDDRNP